MNETVAPKARNLSKKFNRIGYVAFVLLSFYYLIFSRDVSQAMGTLAIALIFDPFDQAIPFGKRPLYQRAWLIVHGICLLILFLFFLKNKI
ncbi:MAG TPA: hypothetical protein VK166_04495 [Chitinophagaceae bacterium]|nr:hypothetical protein [Chitinophagaceae bacterium]